MKVCLFILVLLGSCSIVLAEDRITFIYTDNFAIPDHNSNINFALGGSYGNASLENDIWRFVGLRVNNSGPLENLRVSAQDCNVTIMNYQNFNFGGRGATLRYRVVGHGTQTFNFELNRTGGQWSLVFNTGNFPAVGNGWTVSKDSTITVTGATDNVTLFYQYSQAADTSNRPSYQQHSVIISTGIIVAASAVLVVVVGIKNHNIILRKSSQVALRLIS
jgi:hypothetical protein